jgi:hypothetical protein
MAAVRAMDVQVEVVAIIPQKGDLHFAALAAFALDPAVELV